MRNLNELFQILQLLDDYIFQENNDLKHCSKNTKKFSEIHILTWPAQSSNFSPIEHFWDYFDRQISC